MDLTTALRLNSTLWPTSRRQKEGHPGPQRAGRGTARVALVGGGRNTTTMFTRAHEPPSAAIVASTPDLPLDQLVLADAM